MELKNLLKDFLKSRELKKGLHLQSLEQTNIHRKVGIAFFVASLVPILVLMYLIEIYLPTVASRNVVENFRVLLLLSVAAGVLGFWINRKIASALTAIAREAKTIAEEGSRGRTIETDEKSEEIGSIARTFNKIVHKLEQKVGDLEQSKKLIHNLLRMTGALMTSSRNIDDLLDLLVASMVNSLEAESGVVLLTDRDETKLKLQLKCTYGKNMEQLSAIAALNGAGPFEWVIREKRTLIVNGSLGASGFAPQKNDVLFESILCTPLLFQRKFLGLFALINKKRGGKFNRDDQMLFETVANQAASVIQNAHLTFEAERAYFETIKALAKAVEAKDHYTCGHLQRVSDIAAEIAKAMALPEAEIQTIKNGALLHDIGKIGVSDAILLKPGKLTADEMRIMQTHAADGENIIAPLTSFKKLREIVRGHQEWYNGAGYPDKLRGEQIPLGARILSVADVYDALTTDRPYRGALSHETAVQIIRDETGTHFDPKVVEVFLNILDRVLVVVGSHAASHRFSS